jgi:hypothetical protein
MVEPLSTVESWQVMHSEAWPIILFFPLSQEGVDPDVQEIAFPVPGAGTLGLPLLWQ